ncbi:transcriptional regulator-domain-containing protein [Entophlyctis helioformis]|nr:transcriptional regulator-domain-containing protein [Entophlyctis helioformis]
MGLSRFTSRLAALTTTTTTTAVTAAAWTATLGARAGQPSQAQAHGHGHRPAVLEWLGRPALGSQANMLQQCRFAGHNRWSKIMHAKGANDAARGKVVGRVVRQIIAGIKAMNGETDPSHNHYLAAALHQAREHQLPKANIEDAIKRATGGGKGGEDPVKRIVYEGLSPVKSVAVMVEALTSNSNKTNGEIRLLFKKAPGSAITPVSYLFKRRGRVVFGPGKTGHTMAEMTDAAMEMPIEDIGDEGEDEETRQPLLEVFCEFERLIATQRSLEAAGYEVRVLESGYFGTEPVPLTDTEDIRILEEFVEALENQEEVVKVSHNAHYL